MTRYSPVALLIAGALLVGGFSVGCSHDEKDASGKKIDASMPLWDRLGGEKSVAARRR